MTGSSEHPKNQNESRITSNKADVNSSVDQGACLIAAILKTREKQHMSKPVNTEKLLTLIEKIALKQKLKGNLFVLLSNRIRGEIQSERQQKILELFVENFGGVIEIHSEEIEIDEIKQLQRMFYDMNIGLEMRLSSRAHKGRYYAILDKSKNIDISISVFDAILQQETEFKKADVDLFF